MLAEDSGPSITCEARPSGTQRSKRRCDSIRRWRTPPRNWRSLPSCSPRGALLPTASPRRSTDGSIGRRTSIPPTVSLGPSGPSPRVSIARLPTGWPPTRVRTGHGARSPLRHCAGEPRRQHASRSPSTRTRLRSTSRRWRLNPPPCSGDWVGRGAWWKTRWRHAIIWGDSDKENEEGQLQLLLPNNSEATYQNIVTNMNESNPLRSFRAHREQL